MDARFAINRIRCSQSRLALVVVLLVTVLGACGSQPKATASSPQGISVAPSDFTSKLVTCSQSAQIDDFAAATRQVIHDWSSMKSSGAVTAWIQAIAPSQQGCDTFFNAQYAPDNKIAYSVVIQFKDSTQASSAFSLGVPDLNLFISQFQASAPGVVTGSQTGLGPKSLVLAHTDYNDWDAFWQHSSFLVEFAASNFGDADARAAALHINDRIPDVAPTPSPLAARPSLPADCRDIIAFAPAPASTTLPAMRTEHLIVASRSSASIEIKVPSDLSTSGAQVKDANSLLALGPASGFYPQVTLELYEHKGTMPDAHSLAALEARDTENNSAYPIFKPVVVGLSGLVAGTPGRLEVCFKPEATWPDHRTVIIQFVFPRAAGTGAWDEYLVEVITTVDRYGYDSLVGDAVARSLRFAPQ